MKSKLISDLSAISVPFKDADDGFENSLKSWSDTFLSKKRTRNTYFDKISTKNKSLNNSTRIVFDQFDMFCNSEYSHDSENVIREFLSLETAQQEESACNVYQS